MTASRRRFLIAALAGPALPALTWPLAAQAAPPPLMLAGVYRPGMRLDGCWVSEKYDGMRAYWDGQALWSRGGERIVAPPWFTVGWPAVPLDGELWAGRGRFEFTVSTVRRQQPDSAAWRAIRFMVFDLPARPGTFDERLAALRRLLLRPEVPWLLPVPQQRATTHVALMTRLQRTVRGRGEGLMLHCGTSRYRTGRSDELLKVKPHEEAEARVVAHLPGEGRHTGRLGALLVRADDGRSFRIGSGLSDAQRDNPPPVGTVVTYRFTGLNASGLPRFARFVRVRDDL